MKLSEGHDTVHKNSHSAAKLLNSMKLNETTICTNLVSLIYPQANYLKQFFLKLKVNTLLSENKNIK